MIFPVRHSFGLMPRFRVIFFPKRFTVFLEMWLRVNDHNFVGKKVQRDNGTSIFISDLKQIWHKFVSDEELIAISKKLNPLFEAPLPKFKEITLSLFVDNNNVKKEIVKESNEIILKLQSIKMNAKYTFQISLLKGDEVMLYNEFTVPLVLSVMELQAREQKLIQIIKSKDTEINEYKQENTSFIAGLTATSVFEEEEFKKGKHFDFSIGNSNLDLVEFLTCINSKVSCLRNELEDKSKFVGPSTNCDSNFNAKNSSQTEAFKNAINWNHQAVKKRKKHNKIA